MAKAQIKWVRPAPSEIVCKCACGQEYTVDRWRNLKSIGDMICPPETGEPDTLEMRNCECKTTLGVWLDGLNRHIIERDSNDR